MGTGAADLDRLRNAVRRAIARRSYCTLATSSAANRPHVVGVLYAEVDGRFYVSTLETSTKVRNLRENPRVAVCIPVRRFPVGPPFSVQFQGEAEIRAPDDPAIADLLAGGRLKRITSHGELDDPHACVIKVTPGRRVATYGLGVPLRKLLGDPIHASGSVEVW
jgi:general stress protein 26